MERAARWIHDSTSNGVWDAIAHNPACVGVDCGTTFNTNAPEIWQMNTFNVAMMSAFEFTSGHGALTKSFIVNDGNPPVYRHLITSLGATPLAIFKTPLNPNCCQDAHFNGDIFDDTTPILMITGGPGVKVPGAYFSEVDLISQDGSLKGWRACHTNSSNSSDTGFWGEYAIGSINQPRTVVFFSSDMSGALGTYVSGKKTMNRTDIFACGVAGQ
jgi:hypothetical protein